MATDLLPTQRAMRLEFAILVWTGVSPTLLMSRRHCSSLGSSCSGHSNCCQWPQSPDWGLPAPLTDQAAARPSPPSVTTALSHCLQLGALNLETATRPAVGPGITSNPRRHPSAHARERPHSHTQGSPAYFPRGLELNHKSIYLAGRGQSLSPLGLGERKLWSAST